jgi:hypothetical protein
MSYTKKIEIKMIFLVFNAIEIPTRVIAKIKSISNPVLVNK